MKGTIKVTALILVLVLALGMLAGCKKTPGSEGSSSESGSDVAGTEKAYLFTVVCEDTGAPVAGVQVQICKGEAFCLMPVTTDASGVAKYVLPGDNDYGVYEVHIIGGIPEGYSFDNATTVTDAETRSYTLTLTAGSASDPSSGASSEKEEPSSGLAGSDATSTSAASSEAASSEAASSGAATSERTSDGKTSGKTSEGKTSEKTSEGKTSEKTSDGKTSEKTSGGVKPPQECKHVYFNGKCLYCGEIERKQYTVKVRYESDCTDSKGVAHKAGEAVAGVSLMVTDKAGSQFFAQGKTDAKGELRFTAPVANDRYYVRVVGGVPEGFGCDEGILFQGKATAITVDLFRTVSDVVASGERLPFSAQPLKAGVPLRDVIEKSRGNDEYTIEDESYFYYSFHPEKLTDEGRYRATVRVVSGSNTMQIAQFACSIAYVFGTPEVESKGKEASIEFNIEKDYLTDSFGNFAGQNRWLIGVKADGSIRTPVVFEVEIVKVRDLVPGKDYPIRVTYELELAEGTPSADEITGSHAGQKLTNLPLDTTLVKDAAGYYHVGSASGPYAMIKLNAPNRLLNSDPEVFFCNIDDMTGVSGVCLSETETKNGITTIHIYEYYTLLKQYGMLCNADGAYVVNEELLQFVKGYVVQKTAETGANAYMKGLSYYQ